LLRVLSAFNKTWIFSKGFLKILKYQIPWKSVLGEPKCPMWTYRRTDMTKLMVAFCNFFKALGNCAIVLAAYEVKENTVRKTEFVPSSDKLFQKSTQDWAACIRTVWIIQKSEVKSVFKPLKTKRRPLYLKAQFVPRSKHFSTRLWTPIILWWKWHKLLLLSDKYKTHKVWAERTVAEC
jgi:hypothetical protein